MFASEVRPTSDTENNIKLGGGNTGAYTDYNIVVPETKSYLLEFRYATAMNNVADYSILVDSVEKLRDTLSSTGSWNTFKTIYYDLELPEGKHQLRIYVNKGWYGLNWFDIKEGGVGIEDLSFNQMMIYPNPVIDVLQFKNELNGEMQIIDVTGKVVRHSSLTSHNLDVSSLSTGVYQVMIKEQTGSLSVGRFMKK